MEKQIEKIKRFSVVVCVLLNVAFIFLIVAAAFIAASWIASLLRMNTEVLIINGVETEVPILFAIGGVKVYLPVLWKSGFTFAEPRWFTRSLVPSFGAGDLAGVIVTLIGLRYARKIFLLLKEDGSPFREEVVKALKRLTIVLLVLGAATGVVSFLAAGVTWVLCLVFDYGRALQSESDATL